MVCMALSLTIFISMQGCSDAVTAHEKPSQKLAAIKVEQLQHTLLVWC